MFTFNIRSTIHSVDHSDKILVGDVLYFSDEDERFATIEAAEDAGIAVLNGLDGGRAFNAARDCAVVVAVAV